MQGSNCSLQGIAITAQEESGRGCIDGDSPAVTHTALKSWLKMEVKEQILKPKEPVLCDWLLGKISSLKRWLGTGTG